MFTLWYSCHQNPSCKFESFWPECRFCTYNNGLLLVFIFRGCIYCWYAHNKASFIFYNTCCEVMRVLSTVKMVLIVSCYDNKMAFLNQENWTHADFPEERLCDYFQVNCACIWMTFNPYPEGSCSYEWHNTFTTVCRSHTFLYSFAKFGSYHVKLDIQVITLWQLCWISENNFCFFWIIYMIEVIIIWPVGNLVLHIFLSMWIKSWENRQKFSVHYW